MTLTFSFSPPRISVCSWREASRSLANDLVCTTISVGLAALCYTLLAWKGQDGASVMAQAAYDPKSNTVAVTVSPHLFWAIGLATAIAMTWFARFVTRRLLLRDAVHISAAEREACADGSSVELSFVTDLSNPLLFGRAYGVWRAMAVWKKNGMVAIRPVYGTGKAELTRFRFFETLEPLNEPVTLDASATPQPPK